MVGSCRDADDVQMPERWQQRALLLMMHALSKLVVAHRWIVLMVTLDSGTRGHRMRARSFTANMPNYGLCQCLQPKIFFWFLSYVGSVPVSDVLAILSLIGNSISLKFLFVPEKKMF